MKKDINLILSYTTRVGECLEWVRCFNTDGYPRAMIDGYANGKVHRIVYEILNGPINKGLVIRHTCDNKKCINPDHLIIGTTKDNVDDRNLRSGNGRSKLTKEQVITIRELKNKFSRVEIARMFNVDSRTISSIILGHHWKHVT